MVREVDSRTAAAIAAAMDDEGDLVEARLARGCRCFAAWSGVEVAGYGWLSSGPEWVGEVELEITPGPGEAYIWNCFTIPKQRRRGVFRSLLTSFVEQGRSEGLTRLWIGSLAIPAEKAIPSSGFMPALRLSSKVLSGMVWMRVGTAEETDPTLVEAARKVMAIGHRPLRLGRSLRRSRPRRH